jgi:hypothetical protein
LADQRITQLTALPKAAVAASDVLPIADVSASQTKKVTAKDLVDAGLDLIDLASIDLDKLDQSSTTKLGTIALADDAVTYAKLQNVSATDRLLGRSSAGAGNAEEIPCTAAGRALLDDVDASAQRTTLGLGTIATQSASAVAITGGTITGGTITGITDLAVADGGTGASTAANARVNLGLAIGTNVQAYNPSLQSIAGLTTAADQTIYTTGANTYAVTYLSAAGRALIDDADASAQRTTLGLGSLATQNSSSVTITGGTATLGSATITSATINGGTISGITDLALADGGTGASTASGARTNLGVAIGTDVQAYDAGLQSIANLTTSADQLIYTTAADTYATASLTTAGRALLDDADAAAQRATLGLGSLATQSGTFSGTHSGTSSGTNTGDQTITLTGDVTGSGTGSFAATIASGAVVEAKLGALAVTTGKVADDAITAAKLADSSAAIVAATTPSGSGAFIGQQWINTTTAIEYTWDGSTWLRQASLSTISFSDTSPLSFTVTYPDAYSATITTSMDLQSANRILAGPTTGPDAAPTFRALVPSDLPDATGGTKGIIQPGTGLSVSSGTLNHSNTTTAGTYTKLTVDAQGHITAGTTLSASDIPSLDTSKITSGTFATALLADDAVTAAKMANYSTAQIGSSFPTADFIGQFFLNPLERTVYMWDGNVWQPVGITAGTVIFGGTYDANTNQIASVTPDGSALGLSVGNPLPAASANNQNYFVIVSNAGTGTSPAPAVALLPPDLILSTGNAWVRIESSDAYVAQVATQVSFTPAGQIASTNVQAAIEEVSSECRNATNITSGTLAPTVGGTGITTYAKGDLIAGSGTNTLAKLTAGTTGYVLKANSSTATGLEWAAYDALVTGGGTMTGNLEISSSAAIVFEGSTADTYETTLTVADPTADRTITLPNSTGTVALTSDLDDGTY